MCVITRYADRRLKVYGSNQDEVRKNKNSTSELNGHSLESNSCSPEKQRSENIGSKQKKRKVHFLRNAEREKHVSTLKIGEKFEGIYSLEKAEEEKKVKIQRKSTEQGALTLWRPQKKGKGQDMKENPPSKGHSLSGEQRGRDKLGHGKTMTE